MLLNSSSGVAFELRANVAIRILVERVELEQTPHLTLDQDGMRRKQWQTIAAAALDQYLPPASRSLPAVKVKRKYTKRKPAEVPAKGHVINAADAIQTQLSRASSALPPKQCVYCGKDFKPLPQHYARQVHCGRQACKRKKMAQSKREHTARQKGGDA